MNLCHVTIRTEAFEQEIRFYQTYADLKIERDLRPVGQDIVFLSDGGAQIEVIEMKGAENAGNENLSIGFHAEDLDEIRSRLQKDGFEPGEFISPMPQVRFFFVKDPAGVTVQFI